MRKGFVLGKFLPLHKGHLGLIEFARKHCDFLSVLVCFSANEEIEGIVRKQWLIQELNQYNNIAIISFHYDEKELPNTSVSSREVSKKWAAALKPVVSDAAIVFTSEPYGDYLAEYMNITHQAFDKSRTIFPVSGAAIKNNPFLYWDYITPAARPWYVKKIAVLGSESTGKSVLTEKLAAYFDTAFVPEMAREIIEKTDECTFNHLEEIATLHAVTIGKKISAANKLLFLDTDLTITKSYSHFLFNKELHVEPWIEEANKADLYLFLEPDCPFVQDGTRLNETERNLLSISHKEQLKKCNIDFVSLNGDWNNRFMSAISIVKTKFFL